MSITQLAHHVIDKGRHALLTPFAREDEPVAIEDQFAAYADESRDWAALTSASAAETWPAE